MPDKKTIAEIRKNTNKEITLEYVTANQLIDFGVPRALFWNTADKDKPIERDRMISWSLKRGVNKEILETYVDFFGAEIVKNALEKDKEHMSDRFYDKIMRTLKDYDDSSQKVLIGTNKEQKT
ncbi:MAG: hypothetical protein ABFQ64_06705 [Campylobacterota bacterium]